MNFAIIKQNVGLLNLNINTNKMYEKKRQSSQQFWHLLYLLNNTVAVQADAVFGMESNSGKPDLFLFVIAMWNLKIRITVRSDSLLDYDYG